MPYFCTGCGNRDTFKEVIYYREDKTRENLIDNEGNRIKVIYDEVEDHDDQEITYRCAVCNTMASYLTEEQIKDFLRTHKRDTNGFFKHR